MYTLTALGWFILDDTFRSWKYIPYVLTAFARFLRKVALTFRGISCPKHNQVNVKSKIINVKSKSDQIELTEYSVNENGDPSIDVKSNEIYKNISADEELNLNLLILNRFFFVATSLIVIFFNIIVWFVLDRFSD
jgi:hypothetical protein